MPTIYLSPSTQEKNMYVNGGSEEFWMNLLADAMIPYLRSNGIQYVRNTPDMTAGSSIRASNAGDYDLHIALHSNAAPESKYGTVRGTDVYYAPGSRSGQRFADIVAENLKGIYPNPEKVRALPTTSLGEVTRTKAPAVLIEVAYHDNPEDATWIKNNLDAIARNIVSSIVEYFGLPFIEPQPTWTGTVTLQSGNLNIRSKPSLTAPIIGKAPNGASLAVLGQWEDWYVVNYDGIEGYAKADYIQ